jgi:membrane-bound serine protease (ClpP class)
VQLDTPGGYLESTKEIVQAFSRSPVPVIVYVAPTWASATSAGCFITLAGDVAAMAPHTSIGAAHPVMAGDTGGGKDDQVMNRKLENFAMSYIEAIASKGQRNTEWAKSAVRESASITSERALELKVIEIVAKDLPDLLRQLDGREVKGRKLVTASARVEEISMSYRESIFQMLCRPEVVLVLMLIAIYGIIGELSNPGAILPGVAGGIALVLALYLAAILPINFAGLALIGLALVLFTVDVFAPTHGVLTVGGTLSFFLGAWMLFDPSEPAFQLSLSFILPATLLTAAFFLFAVGKGLRAQSLPVRVGKEAMLGQSAAALTAIDQTSGKVFVEGEYWHALSNEPIEQGQTVEIVGIEGLTLRVKLKNP